MSVGMESGNILNGDVVKPKKMLKRSKSEQRFRPKEPGKSQSKDKVGIFRRSFRKKNKSPAFEECNEDFTSFATHSPITARKNRSQTLDLQVPTGSGSKGSDSDISDLSPMRPSVQALFAEAAAYENGKVPDLGDGGGDGREVRKSSLSLLTCLLKITVQ